LGQKVGQQLHTLHNILKKVGSKSRATTSCQWCGRTKSHYFCTIF